MDIGELSMLLEVIDVKQVTEEEFQSAATKAKNLKGLDQEHQLLLYGLYKQATIGNVNTPQPYSFDFVNSYKWKAWKAYEGFPQKNAVIAYVYIVTQLLCGAPIKPGAASSGEIKESSEGEDNGLGATVSTLYREYDQSLSWKESEAIFQAVVDRNMDKLKESLEKGGDVNVANEEGMTPLHFAADRGFLDIVKLLVEQGATLDVRDATGQTPLMLAVSCENEDVIGFLVSQGADVSMFREENGFDPEDVSPQVLPLLQK